MSASTTRVLVVAGMHRSGTSLTANWLEKCGLDMGEEFIPANYSNPAGHYEDQVFVDLQRDMLRENGTDHWVTHRRPLTVSAALRARAVQVIEARDAAQGDQWGWKDPRTTLFLDFWRSLLPGMKVLVMYRPAAQVVDSLLRRDLNQRRRKGQWERKPLRRKAAATLRQSFVNLPLVRAHLRVWNRYNRDALAFAAAHPDDCLILHVNDLIPQAARVIDYANREWGFHLRSVDAREVYDASLLQSGAMPVRVALATLLLPTGVSTARELARKRQESLERIAP